MYHHVALHGPNDIKCVPATSLDVSASITYDNELSVFIWDCVLILFYHWLLKTFFDNVENLLINFARGLKVVLHVVNNVIINSPFVSLTKF